MRQQVRMRGDVILASVDVDVQDAQEFFLHFLSTIDKGQRLASPSSSATNNSADLFRFQFEDRLECVVSGKVRYTKRDDFLLQLPVPMDMATNKGVAMFTRAVPEGDMLQVNWKYGKQTRRHWKPISKECEY